MTAILLILFIAAVIALLAFGSSEEKPDRNARDRGMQ